MEGLDEWLPPHSRDRNRLTDCAGIIPEIDKILGMAISKELLDILICPVCKGDLQLKEDHSGLKCQQCKRVYPIRDDLPIMLKDQATIEA